MPRTFAQRIRARRFERILQRHRASLYRLALRLTGNPDDAEDLLQDLVERASPRADEVVALDDPRAWLARVLYRLFVDRWRRAQAGPDVDPDAEVEAEAPGDDRDVPDAVFDRLLARERLQAALAELPPAMHDVVLLHDVEGYALVEIAAITDTPVGTLKSRHASGARQAARAADRWSLPGRRFVMGIGGHRS